MPIYLGINWWTLPDDYPKTFLCDKRVDKIKSEFNRKPEECLPIVDNIEVNQKSKTYRLEDRLKVRFSSPLVVPKVEPLDGQTIRGQNEVICGQTVQKNITFEMFDKIKSKSKHISTEDRKPFVSPVKTTPLSRHESKYFSAATPVVKTEPKRQKYTIDCNRFKFFIELDFQIQCPERLIYISNYISYCKH